MLAWVFQIFFGKTLLDLCRYFSNNNKKPFHFLLWCATLLESNRIYPFLILSCCVFFILRKMEQAVDNINLLDLSSLFWWVKRELWEFLYLSFAYSAKIMDHLFWRGWLPLFKSGQEKESRRFYISYSLRYMGQHQYPLCLKGDLNSSLNLLLEWLWHWGSQMLLHAQRSNRNTSAIIAGCNEKVEWCIVLTGKLICKQCRFFTSIFSQILIKNLIGKLQSHKVLYIFPPYWQVKKKKSTKNLTFLFTS